MARNRWRRRNLYPERGGDGLMQEFKKEQHREERKRPRREVRAEENSGFLRGLGGENRKAAVGNRRRRRLVVVFLLVTLATLSSS